MGVMHGKLLQSLSLIYVANMYSINVEKQDKVLKPYFLRVTLVTILVQ